MLKEIRSLISGAKVKKDHVSSSHDRTASAAAVLLIEMAVMDGDFDACERTKITQLLAKQFEINQEEVAKLITEAEISVKEAVDLFSFTRILRDDYEQQERFKIIEMMWEVAYADGIVHDFEANLVRRATGLLNVSDRESGEARKRVLERLDIEGGAA